MNTTTIENQKDKEIFARRQALYNRKKGPRTGDFIKQTNGKYQRFTHYYGEGIQAGASADNVGFYLGNGNISYSGGLNAGVKVADLVETKEIKMGDVWFFHNDEAKAHNGVHFDMAFRVFELKDGSDESGLWAPPDVKF